ncbi:MAG: DUF3243 family protein [Bacillota bacterium]|jgi:hypothetical protein
MDTNNLLKGLDTSSWENYKKSLGQAVEAAEEFGVSNRTIAAFATTFGEFLNQNAKADLPENKAIQELWQAADKKEQYTLAKLMVDICKKSS